MRVLGECRPPGVEHGRESDAGGAPDSRCDLRESLCIWISCSSLSAPPTCPPSRYENCLVVQSGLRRCSIAHRGSELWWYETLSRRSSSLKTRCQSGSRRAPLLARDVGSFACNPPGEGETHGRLTTIDRLPPRNRWFADSPCWREMDFEPSVPHTKQPFSLPRSVPQFAFRSSRRWLAHRRRRPRTPRNRLLRRLKTRSQRAPKARKSALFAPRGGSRPHRNGGNPPFWPRARAHRAQIFTGVCRRRL